MEGFGKFCKLSSDFAEIADFLVIYIEEVHPTSSKKDLKPEDGSLPKVITHKSIEDRLEAANVLRDLKADYSGPIVADAMSDNTNIAYGGLPERLFIIHESKIAYLGGVGPMYYKPEEVGKWLEKYKKNLDAKQGASP